MSIGTAALGSQKAVMKGTSLFALRFPMKVTALLSAAVLFAASDASAAAYAKQVHRLQATTNAGSTSGLHCPYNPYPMMITPVRIGLAVRASVARFALWMPGYVFVNGVPIFDVKPQMVYTIANGRITEMATGRSIALPMDQRSYVSSPPDYRVWTANHWYRGCLELISFGNRVSVINLLDLEEYLLGVVPSEMPANWCLEALKAQAVAARSYAWAHVGNNSKWRSEGFDLVPDVRDQAYNGLAREARSTFFAVHQTRGLVLKDAGRVKAGFYRAWVGDDLNENLNIRKMAVSTAVLEKLSGVKDIVGVTVKQWDAGGNAHDIQVMGAKKTREVYGVELARRLGLVTAGILDVREDGPNWVFTYRGPGNGERGLSQHGANMLASKGWRYDQILQQFYQDPDGKLRLDYLETYKAAFRSVPRPVVAPRPATKTGEETE